MVTGLLGLTGAVYGGFRRARAHWTFTQSLENAQGFIQAMENVNVRTGGAKPLGFTVPSAQRITDDTEPSSGVDIVRDGDWDPKRDTDQSRCLIVEYVSLFSRHAQQLLGSHQTLRRFDGNKFVQPTLAQLVKIHHGTSYGKNTNERLYVHNHQVQMTGRTQLMIVPLSRHVLMQW